ncbi:2-polyprenyl-6-methoxyphenol hydroxylase [Exophiala viscosa]|uniref:2-polyprenyl-6-methoxyphenol hydroxylase n=1 Tax=Exophiala viscosa TaxID=2486360 RepID=A0AAN6E4L7_9EURO|nr:2-polyprenyl-6-methoxyphenol hydroxylase [Exophiala viscosa]
MSATTTQTSQKVNDEAFGERLSNGRLKSEYYEPIPPDHFLPKPGDQILDIGIIGSGIAGLAAAIGLIQSGHNVELYERSGFSNEIGAAINMCPNATRVLSFFQFNFERPKPTTAEEMRFIDGSTLEMRRRMIAPDFRKIYGAPYLLYHRADLHTELKKTATKPRPRLSKVAKINLLSEVTKLDLDGHITLSDGRQIKKDLIVVADGVRSKFAADVVGSEENIKALPSGTMCYRFLVPTQKLLDDPQTRHLYNTERFTMQIAAIDGERLVWYPCRSGDVQNFGFFVKDSIVGFEDEAWNIPTTKEAFMKAVGGLHPDLQAVCEKADDLKLWRLCSRTKPIPRLTRGRVVLIGDAAHPMLPHQGQGGGMAIEDGAALGVLLSNLRSKEQITNRLQLFHDLRIKRVSAMVIFSSVGQDEHTKISDLARPHVDGPLPTNPQQYHDFNFTPNVIRDAMEILDKHRTSGRL